MKLKIPPVLLLIITAILMKPMAMLSPTFVFSAPLWVVLIVLSLGLLIIFLGVWEFKKAKTTVNPINPNQSSQIVSSGIYQFTRNPMYLGMSILLLALAMFLGGILAFFGIVFFVAYIHYLQILPEETILTEKFGKPYQEYCQKVRRWI